MLMVFRATERHQDCTSWIPESEETTSDRLLTATVSIPYLLGRLSEGENQTTGVVGRGLLHITDLKLNRLKLVDEYDVLVVSASCSMAWVPYKAGDTLPYGALQTGVVSGVAVYSIMMPVEAFGQRFGF